MYQKDNLQAAAMSGSLVFASLLGEREEQLDRLRTTVAALRWAAAENPAFDTPILLEAIGELVPAQANFDDAEQLCCKAMTEVLLRDRATAPATEVRAASAMTPSMSIPMVLSLMYALDGSGSKEQLESTLQKLLDCHGSFSDPSTDLFADASTASSAGLSADTGAEVSADPGVAAEAPGYRHVLAEYQAFLRKQGWEARAERLADEGVRGWLVAVKAAAKTGRVGSADATGKNRKTQATRPARATRRRKPVPGAA